ncbi:o-succinylbenzoate synthase [Helcobacillus massiliensis]|uniref:o-succinylbenzoate synthase n=1 Tax=Helcobacillus massiliensis TaxID=521392 RepID=UPI0021A715F5|nr:o-succinylbenzoate synthase [Helcobacillus massiliensis]MCT1558343.1 o-succinylbenzoate synthase [Helcobacillus massiliensis]MCT2036569.1 o-succinylbenzoate synthase [Helcobacillus massiliensis]MCT2332328.1 o-succinylbenzoate synthase [Helcobacillus massiliensis]
MATTMFDGIDRIEVYRIPLTTRFRGLDVREGVLLHGEAGWSEFSPFWDYDAEQSRPWFEAAMESATREFPRMERSDVEINATVPAVGPDEAHRIARSFGSATAKVKVAESGSTHKEDQARLEAVRDALGPEAKIRIDANAGWAKSEAVKRIGQLDRAAGGLEYVEQPGRTIADMAWIRSRVEVPIAADESVRLADDPLEVIRKDAADIMILKVQPMGGITRCLQIAEDADVPVVVSSALESSVGIAMGLALATSLPELPYACGLGTARLLATDVVADPLISGNGRLTSFRQDIDELGLEVVKAPEDVRERWMERLSHYAS